jgi:pyrimidine operon attenuation protein/uracil phosphoribosyltransferase
MSLPQPEQLLEKMASQLQNQYMKDNEDVLMVGIHSGGAWVAQELHKRLGLTSEIGFLDISFYRDDFTKNGLNPQVKGSQLPNIENKTLILVDDVIMSGRTIRAAMNELFDYGRPNKIVLACLLDTGKRELPIQADVVGEVITLKEDQRIKLNGPEPLVLSLASLVPHSSEA